jgi:NAD(P)-dependent dehydrogenase (short-subunit alcohol dehydrogenase family)
VDDLERVFATNFFSQFVGCKHALPHLRKTKGNIINMSSCTAMLSQEGATLYTATKGAICSFTKSLAIDEAQHGVRVNAVLPGNIYTDSRAQLIQSLGEHGAQLDRWADAMQHFGRSGTTYEAGQVCLFLASDAASFLTGLDLYISAGIEIGVGMKYPPLCV